MGHSSFELVEPSGVFVRGFLFLLAPLFVVGCIATPIPEPPNIDPPNPDAMTGQVLSSVEGKDILFTGHAGAATADTDLWAVNLNRSDPPELVEVWEDGSFEVTLPGDAGDELRLQLRRDEARSAPIDVIARDLETPVPVTRDECLVLDPSLELGFGAVYIDGNAPGSITVRNNCTEEVVVTDLGMRIDTGDFIIDSSPPISIDSGSSGTVEVSFTPTGTGLIEELLFVYATGSVNDRWPVMLVGRGE